MYKRTLEIRGGASIKEPVDGLLASWTNITIHPTQTLPAVLRRGMEDGIRIIGKMDLKDKNNGDLWFMCIQKAWGIIDNSTEAFSLHDLSIDPIYPTLSRAMGVPELPAVQGRVDTSNGKELGKKGGEYAKTVLKASKQHYESLPSREHWPDTEVDGAVKSAKHALASGMPGYQKWADFDGALGRPRGAVLDYAAGFIMADLEKSGQNIEIIREQYETTSLAIGALSAWVSQQEEAGANAGEPSAEFAVRREALSQLRESRIKILGKMYAEWQKHARDDANAQLVGRCSVVTRIGSDMIPKKDEVNQSKENRLLILLEGIAATRRINPSLAPRIIVAQCTSAEEILRVREIFQEKHPDISPPQITPLFEDRKATDPAFVWGFLQKIWSKLGPKEATKTMTEVFVAGSDLSRLESQPEALSRTVDVGGVVALWNHVHGTNLQVRLGAGEHIFRQGYGKNVAPTGVLRQDLSKSPESVLGITGELRMQMHASFPKLVQRLPFVTCNTIQPRGDEYGSEQSAAENYAMLEELASALEENRQAIDEYFEKHRQELPEGDAWENWEAHLQKIKHELLGEKTANAIARVGALARASYQAFIFPEYEKAEDRLTSFAGITQLLALLGPKLRARDMARGGNGGLAGMIKALLDSKGIETRTIAANTPDLVPLVLIGYFSQEMSDFFTQKESATESGAYLKWLETGFLMEFLEVAAHTRTCIDGVLKTLEQAGMNANEVQALHEGWQRFAENILPKMQEEGQRRFNVALGEAGDNKHNAKHIKELMDPNVGLAWKLGLSDQPSRRGEIHQLSVQKFEPHLAEVVEVLANIRGQLQGVGTDKWGAKIDELLPNPIFQEAIDLLETARQQLQDGIGPQLLALLSRPGAKEQLGEEMHRNLRRIAVHFQSMPADASYDVARKLRTPTEGRLVPDAWLLELKEALQTQVAHMAAARGYVG